MRDRDAGSWFRWPTPTTADGMGGPGNSGRQGGENPRTAVTRWPTPTARDHKDTGDSIMDGTVPVNGLLGRAVGPSRLHGALNPTWVEWLMGFPLGWTACEHLATPLFRKSLKSSDGDSST
jgi:hypothetical protein